MDEHLAVVVCPNGMGHFHRVLCVLVQLLRLTPRLKISIICEAWQKEQFQTSTLLRELMQFSEVIWIHGLLIPGIAWSQDESLYQNNCLTNWVRRLQAVHDLNAAKVVVSDNLAGVLEIRPDAVLMGSFLWSDVLEDAYGGNTAVMQFVEWERNLLAHHRPFMLCLKSMAMPNVRTETQPVYLPWMRSGDRVAAHGNRRHRSGVLRILLLPGSTGKLETTMFELAAALIQSKFEVALPGLLCRLPGCPPEVITFTYSEADFLRCDLAVCRPGIGAIQDCIFYCLPMVLIEETQNSEMRHNAQCLVNSGLAMALSGGADPESMSASIAAFANAKAFQTMRRQMSGETVGGDQRAAQWLSERLQHAS